MKYTIPNNSLRCLLCILICFIESSVYSQDELTPVSRELTVRGVECFRTNVRRGRRSKVTQQVTVSYSTLQRLLNEANPDSNIQFILVAIDKKFPGSDAFKKNNVDKSNDDLDNKQAIIVKFASKTGTALTQPGNLDNPGSNDIITSSVKSSGNPFRKIAENSVNKPDRPGMFYNSIRYALGRLCPPPECSPL
jgi:hypothetical protein